MGKMVTVEGGVMGLTEISDFLKVMDHLPTNYKIIFAVLFFAVPKMIQVLGGGKVLGSALSKAWHFLVETLRNYQARKQMEVEDEALTEAYTRTLVVESLKMFVERLNKIEEKIDLALELLGDDESKG